MQYLCNKTLKMKTGEICFVKGNIYKAPQEHNPTDQLDCLVDEQGEDHWLRPYDEDCPVDPKGDWDQYFEPVKD